MGPRTTLLLLGIPPLVLLVGIAWLAPLASLPVWISVGASLACAALWFAVARVGVQQRALLAQLDAARREVAERTAGLAAARQATEQAAAAKRNFLATVGHELRTPMTAIIGMTRLALATDLNSRQRDYLNRADRAAHMLLAQINDILDFVRADSGEMQLTRVGFRVDDVLDAVLARASLAVGEKGLQVRLDRDPAIPAVLLGDPRRLEQVLGALADNAVKFTEQGEVLIAARLVELQSARAEVCCEVSDTGGQAAAVSADLFDAFRQGDGSLTRRYGGAGLGLGLCRRLVERMGGQLRMEQVPGFGTRFRVLLGFGVEEVTPLSVPRFAATPEPEAEADNDPQPADRVPTAVPEPGPDPLIDFAAARLRCGTDQRLRRLLRRFVSEHLSFVDDYRALYHAGDRNGAARLARELTSGAAGLGARTLAVSAAHLGLMRRADDSPDRLLEQVGKELASVLTAVDGELSQPPALAVAAFPRRLPRHRPRTASGKAPAPVAVGCDAPRAVGEDLRAGLQRLAGLLAEFDAAAINTFERLRPALTGLGHEDPLDALQNDILGFDFTRALPRVYEFARIAGVNLAAPPAGEVLHIKSGGMQAG